MKLGTPVTGMISVDWGHPVLEHKRGCVSIVKQKKDEKAGKETVIAQEVLEDEINNKMVKALVGKKL